ncbi:hypothetical protein QOZ80_1AG0034980 [Eleusine coracana subsp. coracana]|nr:hypothetical protein QOZ80_1AG0034980 [Eleusine coracana subsp. coracana]
MRAGTDVQAAAADAYDAKKATTGGGGCSWAAFLENDTWFPFVLIAVMFTVALLMAAAFTAIVSQTYEGQSFSVQLTGYDGIDLGCAARVVSPSFNITIRMNNTCVDSADLAITYSGVALGWAAVEPRDCEKRRWERDVEVVARGRGVGLSQRLRDRMASDWRSGTVELDVDVKMYHRGRHSDTTIPKKMILRKVKITDESNNKG